LLIELLKPITMATEITYDILMTGRENTSDAFDDILFAMKYHIRYFNDRT